MMMRQGGPNKNNNNRGRNRSGPPQHGGGGGNNGGNRRPQGPNRNQNFDSNGPDVRIRGSAYQVFERYLNLARDATAAGDRVMAESYYQHAEHYHRIINVIEFGEDGQRRPRQDGPSNNGPNNNGYNQGQDQSGFGGEQQGGNDQNQNEQRRDEPQFTPPQFGNESPYNQPPAEIIGHGPQPDIGNPPPEEQAQVVRPQRREFNEMQTQTPNEEQFGDQQPE